MGKRRKKPDASVEIKPSWRKVVCGQCGGSRMVPTGSYLKSLRDAAGLTMKDVAVSGKTSVQYIWSVENDSKNPGEKILLGYSNALGVDVTQVGAPTSPRGFPDAPKQEDDL